MADFMDILKTRRSIRHFLDKPVPGPVLTQVLEAVQWSPSWANTQCWEVVAVTDNKTKENLAAALAPGNPGTKAIIEAPVVLALAGKTKSAGYYKGQQATKFEDWCMFDLGIASQSICLAAHALGLGTVIIGLLDHGKAKAALKIAEGYELLVLIPLGYAAKDSKAPKRRELSDFVHKDVFGNRETV